MNIQSNIYNIYDSYERAIREAWDDETGTDRSTATITDYYGDCKAAVCHAFYNGAMQRGKIGGPGKIVQVDEAKVLIRRIVVLNCS